MNIRTTIALAAAALLTTLVVPTASAGAAVPSEERASAPRTELTFTVDDCEGCEIQLVNARRTLDADVVHVWQSRTRTVEDGTVTFRVATKRTWGLSVTVRAPWEGHTGYATTAAWRYNGKFVGDPITL